MIAYHRKVVLVMIQNRIRMLRKEAGYNQKELGEILKVGQTTVSAWEIGRNEPDNESSHKMAKLFGCSIGYLMGYESESEYRGLSEKEWNEFQQKKRNETAIRQEITEILHDPDEEELRQLARETEKAEQLEEKGLFPESKEIDAILERTDTNGRKRAVQVIELMFPLAGQ